MNMEGVKVEICNKKGFEGLYLVATIKRLLVKNKDRVLVEYQTLLTKKGSKPLQEYLDLSCLRPLQPQQNSTIFQLNQVVDAFSGQGWRKGVIRKVLEDSKYSVYIENSEEEMEFKHGELRVHLEWIDGKWVDSEFREQCKRDRKNWRCREMSAPGKAYCEKHQMMSNIRNEKRRKRPRESSPFFMEHFLPSELQQCRRNGKGWRCREMTSPGKIYCEKHQMEQDTHNQKRRKMRVEQSSFDADGSTEGRTPSGNHLLPSNLLQHRGLGHVQFPDAADNSAVSNEIATQLSPGEARDNFCADSSLSTPHLQFQKEQRAQLMKEPLFSTGVDGGDHQMKNVLKKRGRSKDSGTEDEASNSSPASVQIDCTRLLSPIVRHEPTFSLCLEKTNPSLCGDEATSDDLTIVPIDRTQLLISTVEEEHQTLSSCLEKSNPPSAVANGDKELVLNEKITLRDPLLENLNHFQSADEEMSSFGSEARGDDTVLQSSIVAMTTMNSCLMQQDVRPPLKNQSLPFIKKSHLWGVLESMEVFQLVPQNPHFRPLEKENEELREGTAIGYMVNFANLMQRTCEIHIDDPRSKFEMKLMTLPSFEELGFAVEPIRSGLEELVKIKDSYHQFGDRLKTADEMVDNERRQSDETQESIVRLKMELQALLTEKEMKILDVAELQRTAEEIEGMMEGTRLDFYGLVSTAW